MKQLIKTIYYFSDGTYKEVLAHTENETNKIEVILNETFSSLAASARTKVNISVYSIAKLLYHEGTTDYINQAISIVTKHQGLTKATICDKMYRQLGISGAQYKKLIAEAVELGNLEEYKNILISYASTRSKEEDLNLINKYVK